LIDGWLSTSLVQLPAFYNEILNHPHTCDDLRRATESKLLRHRRQYLHSLPPLDKSPSLKESVATELESLVNGAVMLSIPDELAWMIYIEGKNCETIGGLETLTRLSPLLIPRVSEGYDYPTLRQFMKLFPSSSMTCLLEGYFSYMAIPQSSTEASENSEEQETRSQEDALDMILVSHVGRFLSNKCLTLSRTQAPPFPTLLSRIGCWPRFIFWKRITKMPSKQRKEHWNW
jgi:hypothetical protein